MLDHLILFAQKALGDGSTSASDWKSGLLNVVYFAGAILIPFVLGRALAKWMKMQNATLSYAFIFFCLLGSVFLLVLPKLDSSAAKLLYGPDIVGGMNLIYEIDRSSEDPLAEKKVTARDFVLPLVNRLNPTGTLEIKIRPNGDDRIEITMPLVDDSQIAEIEKKIKTAGILEFRIIANESDHKAIIDRARAQASSDDLNVRIPRSVTLVDKTTGEEREVGIWRRLGVSNATGVMEFDGYSPGDIVRNGRTGRILEPPPSQKKGDLYEWLKSQGAEETFEVLLALERGANKFKVVTGLDLQKAQKSFGKMGGYEVNFTMTTQGSNNMLALTSSNLPTNDFKRRMAILLDNNVLSAPNLNATISTSGVITGNFSELEVQRLVDILNGGALPGVLIPEPVARNVVGANMGEYAIKQSFTASFYSLIATILLTVFYYRFSGLIATVALLFNLMMVVAVMVLIKQPLTLSGVAGLVLSVGMSVDANVLIFERMREETEKKASARVAIRNGFDRAWTAIFDSNLTTLISAFVLYWVGTEQIKGFAASLIIGIACSMFTAVFFSHRVFDICEKLRFLNLSMADYVNTTKRAFFGAGNVDFMKFNRLFITGSILLCVASIALTAIRGRGFLDIDFNGGTSVVFSTENSIPEAEVRKIVSSAFDKDENNFPIQTSLISVSLENTPKDSVYKLDTSVRKKTDVTDRLLKGFSEGAPSRLMTYDVEVSAGAKKDKQSSLTSRPDTRLVSFQEKSPETSSSSEATSVEAVATPVESSTLHLRFKRSVGDGEAKIATSELIETLISAAKSQDKALVEAQLELRPIGKGSESWNKESSLGFSEWDVTLPFTSEVSAKVGDAFKELMRNRPVWQSISLIEGSVASEMQQRAWAALILSLILITAYIWFRFQNVAYGIAAVIALVHDVLITLGALAICHWLFQPLGFLLIEDFKISLTIVAALLTIIGYSLNDTIVVFDRIREVKGKSPRLTREMINASVTQTLSRTLLTSSTTIVALFLMYFLGGEGIHAFSFCLLVGVLVGTYSSIFVASPILLWWMEREQAKPRRGTT